MYVVKKIHCIMALRKEKNTRIRSYTHWQTQIQTRKGDLQTCTKKHTFTPPHSTLTHTYKQNKHPDQTTLKHTCMTIDTTREKTECKDIHTHIHTYIHTHTHIHTQREEVCTLNHKDAFSYSVYFLGI